MENNSTLTRTRHLQRFSLYFIVMMFGPLLAFAQKTAIASGSWNDAANWSPAGIPTATDAVSIPSGITITIDVSLPAVAASIQVNNGASLSDATLVLDPNASLTVTGVISLGNSNGASGILSMGGGSTLSTAGFFITPGSAASTFNPGTGSVTLTANNTLPATGFNTFNNLTLAAGISGSSKVTNVSSTSDLTINGTLTTNSFSILNLGTARLVVASVNNNGTIETQNTLSTTPIPSGLDWRGSGNGGTVLYDASAGGQSIVAGTYNNLYIQHNGVSPAESLATGAIAIGGQIATLNTSTVLNMQAFQILSTAGGGVGSQINVGTIRTQYASTDINFPAVPLGRTWGGTVQYDAPTGGQKIISGTYQNLIVLTNGTDLGSANIVVNGNLVSSLTTIINLASEQLTGTFDATGFAGTLQVQAASLPFPTGKTWGGTIQYNGTLTAQNIVSANYNNLVISNFRSFNVVFPANINVAGNLTFSAILEDADFITTGSTVTLNGAGAQAISITSQKNVTSGGAVVSTVPFAFNNVTITGGGTKTLSTPVRIAGLLTLSSGPIAGSGTLILESTASVTGGSTASYVASQMEWLGTTAFTFPLGGTPGLNGTAVYAPVTISAPGAGGDVLAQYFRASAGALNSTVVPPLTRVSGCEYWFVKKNSGANAISATLTWSSESGCNGGTTYINDLASLRIAQLTGSGWTSVALAGPPSGTTTAGSITTDLEPDFGNITLATEGNLNPLPVRFLSVNALRKQGTVSVNWTTATEWNVDRYEVERSEDGRSFGTITRSAPLSNNSTGASYTARDAAAPAGTVFYRIKAVDIDGHLTYSNTVRLQSSNAVPVVGISPNPASSREVMLQTEGFAAGSYDVVLYDLAGRPVFRQHLTQESGSSNRTLNLPAHLAAGYYQLHIEGMGLVCNTPLILQ
jgi:hypothetical protein